MNPTQTPETDPFAERREKYREAAELIRLFYDFQDARIAYGHRSRRTRGENEAEIILSPEQQDRLARLNKPMAELERLTLKEANKVFAGHPVYDWLISQRGISVTLAPVLMGSLDIFRANTPSKFWAVCGLGVRPDGTRDRPIKGEKLHYNPHLKSRCFLLGECMIKANNVEWRKVYDGYKHRKSSMRVHCMACDGTGTSRFAEPDEKELEQEIADATQANDAAIAAGDGPVAPVLEQEITLADVKAKKRRARKPKQCLNCEGTGMGPWGVSAAHRHKASMRYMVKLFLAELWKRWREHEGLEVRVPYAEQYLGMKPHNAGVY